MSFKLIDNSPNLVIWVTLVWSSFSCGFQLIGTSLYVLVCRCCDQLSVSLFGMVILILASWIPLFVHLLGLIPALSLSTSTIYITSALSPTPLSMCICWKELIISSTIISIPLSSYLYAHVTYINSPSPVSVTPVISGTFPFIYSFDFLQVVPQCILFFPDVHLPSLATPYMLCGYWRELILNLIID